MSAARSASQRILDVDTVQSVRFIRVRTLTCANPFARPLPFWTSAGLPLTSPSPTVMADNVQLVQRATLKGHNDWVTALATPPNANADSDGVLVSASRGFGVFLFVLITQTSRSWCGTSTRTTSTRAPLVAPSPGPSRPQPPMLMPQSLPLCAGRRRVVRRPVLPLRQLGRDPPSVGPPDRPDHEELRRPQGRGRLR